MNLMCRGSSTFAPQMSKSEWETSWFKTNNSKVSLIRSQNMPSKGRLKLSYGSRSMKTRCLNWSRSRLTMNQKSNNSPINSKKSPLPWDWLRQIRIEPSLITELLVSLRSRLTSKRSSNLNKTKWKCTKPN